MAVAAALVIVTSGAYLATRSLPTATPGEPLTIDESVDTVTRELALAVHHYERAISELEALTRGDRHDVDPALAAGMRDGLDALDRAIAESRQALVRDPTSEPARLSLFDALHRKIDLLQTTALLMSEAGQDQQDGISTTPSGGAS